MIIHSFARPPPRTMTKEWQEATNEYLKVKLKLFPAGLLEVTFSLANLSSLYYRKRDPTLFMVSAARDTLGKVLCRASRRGSNEHKIWQEGISTGCMVSKGIKRAGEFSGTGIRAHSICLRCRTVSKCCYIFVFFLLQRFILNRCFPYVCVLQLYSLKHSTHRFSHIWLILSA